MRMIQMSTCIVAGKPEPIGRTAATSLLKPEGAMEPLLLQIWNQQHGGNGGSQGDWPNHLKYNSNCRWRADELKRQTAQGTSEEMVELGGSGSSIYQSSYVGPAPYRECCCSLAITRQ
jgi:hypothetical protein